MPAPALYIQSPDEAEVVYYEAFMNADIDVMSALWARDDVVCVHPGSGVIAGYDAVLRSWRHILENSGPAEIRYSVIHKTHTEDLAVHLVSEEIIDQGTVMAVVVATNIFQKFPQSWKMIEHHASVVQQDHDGETMQ